MNVAFTEVINELAADVSDAMLRHFYSRTDNPRYQMRVKWQPGTVVMWDNWVAQRYARGTSPVILRGSAGYGWHAKVCKPWAELIDVFWAWVLEQKMGIQSAKMRPCMPMIDSLKGPSD